MVIVRYLTDKFESVNGLQIRSMDAFHATATFDVGYLEGC